MFIATFAGCAGGAIRDVLINKPSLVLQNEVYVTPVVIGAAGLMAVRACGGGEMPSFLTAMLLTTGIRLRRHPPRLAIAPIVLYPSRRNFEPAAGFAVRRQPKERPMKTMKALVKSKREEGLWLEEVPVPEPGINDVLIEVLRTGICGTDVHIYNWDAWAQKTVPVPLVVGHEFVGRIVEVGSNVKDFHPGDIVSGEGHVVCGRCRNCLAGRRHLCKDTQGIGVNRPGAFAEYLSLPMTNVWVHDPSIPRDLQAIFDPFGNAVHTALQFPVLGEDVLVTGAGPIGIMAAAVARHAGARLRGRHRRESLPPGPGPAPGRHAHRRRPQQLHRLGPGAIGHARRL